MPDFDDTTAYPVFGTKKALLREVWRQIEHCVPNALDLMYRLSNTQMGTDPGADGDTVYDPKDTWNTT